MKSATSLRLLVALLALTAIGLSALYWVNLLQGHAQLRADTLVLAERRALQLADAKASELDALVRGVDASLRQFRDGYVRSGEETAVTIAQSAIKAFPRDAIAFFSLLDARGRVVYSSQGATSLQAGDSDDFSAHRGSTTDSLRISKPIQDADDGRWVVLISRPIFMRGRFAGVVEVAMSIGYLANRLAQLELEKDDVVSVFFRDGHYLARSHGWQDVMGMALPGNRPFLVKNAPESGVIWINAVADQQERLYAWQRLSSYPLILIIGLNKSGLMDPVNNVLAESLHKNAAAIVSALLLMAGIAWLLLKNARQQEYLLASETLMRSTLNATSDGMAVVDRAGHMLNANPRFFELWGFPAGMFSSPAAPRFEAIFDHLSEPERAREIWRGWNEKDEERRETLQLAEGRVLEVYLRAFDLAGRRVRLCCFRDVTESRRIEAELKAMATTDALTGLPNRRHFLQRLVDEMDRVKRIDGYRAALLLLDIDHFKKINDSQGHVAGDAVLRMFASLVSSGIRAIDMAGRLGGEEFGVILPQADCDAARRYAERLRQSICEAEFAGESGLIPVTVSIGVTQILPSDRTAETVLNRADQGLYGAKNKGRDRVEVVEVVEVVEQSA